MRFGNKGGNSSSGFSAATSSRLNIGDLRSIFARRTEGDMKALSDPLVNSIGGQPASAGRSNPRATSAVAREQDLHGITAR
jgi:hypothetical protein